MKILFTTLVTILMISLSLALSAQVGEFCAAASDLADTLASVKLTYSDLC